MPAQIDVKALVQRAIDEIRLVSSTLNEKGAGRFGRALGVAGFVIFAAYVGVYVPPQKKSARLQSEINKAKLMAQYAMQYKDLRDQLRSSYDRLPAIGDREQWLSNSVRDSLNVGGLVTEDFKPIREQEQSGLIFQDISVSMTVQFAELYDWILRLESAKPMLRLSSLTLVKKTNKTGWNTATCLVATVIPKKRFR